MKTLMMRYKSSYPLGTFLIKQKTTKKLNQATQRKLVNAHDSLFESVKLYSYRRAFVANHIFYKNSIRMEEIHNTNLRFILF